MKGRPRRVENKVADYLSAFFIRHGHEPVERIPVLGRSGPDITYNETKLIVDVKSRKSVPKCFTVPAQEVWMTHYYILTPLGNMDAIAELPDHWGEVFYRGNTLSSTMVDRWWIHMNEWTKDNEPDGTTALVLHRTGAKIASATVVILTTRIWRFCELVNSKK